MINHWQNVSPQDRHTCNEAQNLSCLSSPEPRTILETSKHTNCPVEQYLQCTLDERWELFHTQNKYLTRPKCLNPETSKHTNCPVELYSVPSMNVGVSVYALDTYHFRDESFQTINCTGTNKTNTITRRWHTVMLSLLMVLCCQDWSNSWTANDAVWQTSFQHVELADKHSHCVVVRRCYGYSIDSFWLQLSAITE